MERQERRGSLGRALERLKTVMKRRSTSSKTVPTLATSSTTQEPLRDTADAAEPTTTESPTNLNLAADADTSDAAPATEDAAPLLADDRTTLEADDNDEALLPMVSSRIGINEGKARELFEKYGLTYQPRKTSSEQEPPSKLRRVEKPVRIRVHWTCHECQGHFARDRTCVGCGHHRCASCTRAPGKRVKEIVDTTKQLKEQEEQQQTMSSTPTKAKIAPVAAVALDKSAQATLPEVAPTQSLEKDDHTDEDDATVAQPYSFLMQVRPRNAEDLILRPKSQIIRRSCHKCETPFIPANRTECENCEHTRCTLCPRYPAKPEKWPQGSPGDEKAPEEEVRMVRAVQRVYKKPRQRVRYTCDKCQTVFLDRERCRECGHGRCKECTRYPYVQYDYRSDDAPVLTSTDPKETRWTPTPSSRRSSQTGSPITASLSDGLRLLPPGRLRIFISLEQFQ